MRFLIASLAAICLSSTALAASSVANATPRASAKLPRKGPPQEERIEMFEDPHEHEHKQLDCPPQFFYCIKVTEAKAMARNLKKLREYIRDHKSCK